MLIRIFSIVFIGLVLCITNVQSLPGARGFETEKKKTAGKTVNNKKGEWKQFDLFFEKHFERLPDKNMLYLGDGYSRILGPLLNKPSSSGNGETQSAPTVNQNAFTEISRILVSNNLAVYRHVNYFTFKQAFQLAYQYLVEENIPIKVLETGSAAYGTESSKIFAAFVNTFGGSFDTIDMNPTTTAAITDYIKSNYPNLIGTSIRCWNGDSVKFIKNFNTTANLVYLDSYDLAPERYLESAQHGLNELNALARKLEDTAIILIDDTPSTREILFKVSGTQTADEYVAQHGRMPGKGELILKAIMHDRRFTVITHQYQLLILFRRQKNAKPELI